ncbi:GNAT family N-acetyltransferase [Fulvivirgaceae bacterium BMA10]|uniref:GNAT family N-acetyltransferase n=1 Tax=Splendidivirga corallicola TaxID=3051826 RepID=A0ABT8KMC3_9BACT|nr:GNAT family N-acetyltransferase [Fulvivirgaceae bacterium BMA10]
MEVEVIVAREEHMPHAVKISSLMEEASKVRGTGIAKRSVHYLQQKMKEGKAVIALRKNEIVGFCYIETWSHGKYVANSGLIVHPDFRNTGLAKKIKIKIFRLSQKKYPKAKIFGITTSLAVMKINSALGYRPVTFSELTTDEQFWKGCKSCKNYDILTRTERKHCLCTGMLYDGEAKPALIETSTSTAKIRKLQKVKKFFRRMKTGMKRKAVKV